MAVVNLVLGVPNKITLGLVDVAQEVRAPFNCGLITLWFETNEGRYSGSGTDGGAMGDTYIPVNPDVPVTKRISEHEHGLTRVFFLGGSVNATVVRVLAEIDEVHY